MRQRKQRKHSGKQEILFTYQKELSHQKSSQKLNQVAHKQPVTSILLDIQNIDRQTLRKLTS